MPSKGGIGRIARAARAVFRSADLLRAEIAFGCFSIAEYAIWVAMLVYAFDRGGAVATGVVAAIQLVPATIAAPFASLLIDRYRRERVLLFSYLAQGLAIGATAIALWLDASPPLVVLLATVANTTLVTTRPVQGALFPELASDAAEVAAANSTAAVVESLGMLIGPAVAGLILVVAGPAGVYATMAVVTLIGAVVVLPMRPRRGPQPLGTSRLRDILEELRAGIRAAVELSGPRQVVALMAAESIVIGLLDVLTVVLARDVLRLDDTAVGYLLAAVGVGGVLGGTASIALAGRRRLTPVILTALLADAVLLALLASAAGLVPALVLMTGIGASHALLVVTSRTLLQRSCDPLVMGRVFGVLEALYLGSLTVGAILGPALIGLVGPTAVWLVVAAYVVVAGLLLWRGLARIDATADVPAERIALVRSLPIFSFLPPLSAERAAGSLVPLDVSRGIEIVREGEVGDRYYVVESGSVEVSQHGAGIRTLAAGDGFGEIALLYDMPRTATVTATEDSRLLMLSRDAFLTCVMAFPSTRRLADTLAEQRLAADLERGSAG